jgi:hypothetical protein
MGFLALAALVLASGGPGCGRHSPSGPYGAGNLHVELKVAADATPPAPLGGVVPFDAFDSLHVSVFDAGAAPSSAVPLAEAGQALAPGTRTFRFDFEVPPAPAYRVRAEVYGVRLRLAATSPTLPGLQLLGEGRAEPSAQAEASVVILLRDAVPRPSVTRGNDLVVDWNAVPLATAYSVLASDSFVVATGIAGTSFQSVDPNLFSRTFRVRAEFGPTLIGAYSEPSSAIFPPPVALSLVPDSVVAGLPTDLLLSIQGTGFAFGAAVEWDDTLLTPSVSSTLLQVTVPASRLATVASHAVTVRNPDGQRSNTLPFRTVAGSAAPVLTSLSPDSAYAQGPPFTLTVDGSDFAPGATILWNSSGLTTTPGNDPTRQLQAVVGATLLRDSTTVTIQVRNPDGQTSASLPISRVVVWSALTPLPVTREQSTVLEVRGSLYVLAGINGTVTPDEPLKTLDRYDPVSGGWEGRPPMPADSGVVEAVAIDERIIRIGTTSNGIAVYWSGNNFWQDVPSVLGDTLSGAIPAVVGNTIYLLHASGLYTLDSGNYIVTRVRDFALPPGRERTGYSVAVLDGLIYVLGGSAGARLIDWMDAYDPVSGTWSTRSNMPCATGPVTALNGRLFRLGECVATLFAYTPADDQWRLETYPPAAYSQSGMAALGNRLYFFGGADRALSSADAWSYAPPPVIPR